jgi:arylsulfatase A-like enzyme
MGEVQKALLLLFFNSALFLSCLSGTEVQEERPKPNILLILTDDQGWGDLGVHRNELIETPQLDKLAASSMEMERFYVSPVCAPTRASLLTGRYHLRTGTTWVTHREEVMREEELTIAELLSANGYSTGLFGKWHNGKQYPHDPMGQGFQEFYGFTEGHLNNFFDTHLQHNFSEVQTEGYVPDLITDKAISFMQEKEPFFCYLAFNTPHSPFQVPDSYFNKYKAKGLDDKTAAVYGMVENIDDNIGRALEALKQAGKLENTVVVFLSDNGPNGKRYNGGFKGIKASVDEGGVRSPFFISYPRGGITAGKIANTFGAHIDLLPTLAELAGVPVPDSVQLDGISLVPVLKQQQTEVGRFFYTHQVVRQFDSIPGAVRSHQYLLILQPDDTAFYNLLKDPYQTLNLAKQQPALVQQYLQNYQHWLKDVVQKGIEPALIQTGHQQVPLVEFPAPEAITYGGVGFQGGEGWANDWFIKLNRPADSVSWRLEAVAEQAYTVSVQMATDVPVKLLLELGDQRLTKTIQAPVQAIFVPNQDRVPRGEVEERIWKEVELGTLVLKPGQHRLKLAPMNEVQGKLEIKSLRLRPVG